MLQRMHCPNCGAGVHPVSGMPTVRCTYCGTTSSTQMPAPEPKPPPSPYPYPAPHPSGQPAGMSLFTRVIYAIAALGIVVTFGQLALQRAGVVEQSVQWNSSRPLLFADIDGDGALEIVGWVNVFTGELRAHVAAYDGATGRQRWISPDLGTHVDAADAALAIADGHLLHADGGGKLTAYRLADVTPLWSIALGERVRQICATGPGQATVVTADEQARIVTLADGSFKAGTAPAACVADTPIPAVQHAAWHGGPWPGPNPKAADEGPPVAVPGMSVDTRMTVAPGLQVALGNKDPGTRVPMVAVVKAGAALWSSVVPAADPLKASEGAPDIATADPEQLFVVYTMRDSSVNPRIAAFAVDGGRRLWDEAIPESTTGSITQMVAVQDRLLVAHWTWLRVFDRQTGALRYTIGRWR